MADEKILDRVAKLLKLAERAGTPEEAEVAYEKATALMTKYAIEQWQLSGRGKAKAEQVITITVHIKEQHDYTKSRQLLLHVVAKANRCEAIINVGRHQMTIYGFESDARFTETLYGLLLVQMEHAGANAYRDARRELDLSGVSRFRYLKSFFYAFALRIDKRFDEANRREESNHVGSALVLADRQSVVKAALPAKLGKARGTRLSTRAGLADGDAAGRRADISGGRNNLPNNKREIQ